MPADAAARAAAAGRVRRASVPAAPRADGLVPTTAIENRAQARAEARRSRLGLGAPTAAAAVANPGAGMPGQLLPPGFAPAMAESVPARLVPAGWQPGPSPAYPAHPYATVGRAPSPYAPATGPQPWQPYAPPSWQPQHAPIAPMLPPRVAWTQRQRSAALLSSWLGQTVMALATHLLTAFTLIVGFALVLHLGGDSIGDFEADSFTSVLARWSMPDRVWATALVGLLVGGGLLAAGWLLHALWARSAGLAKPHRSAWLAWLCTTAATGLIGMVLWPFALISGLMLVLLADDASLTTGTVWSVLFWELGLGALLTGGVGLLFGRLFLSQARPRIDLRAIAEAEEAAARARDEAELTAVRLRGEAPSGGPAR